MAKFVTDGEGVTHIFRNGDIICGLSFTDERKRRWAVLDELPLKVDICDTCATTPAKNRASYCSRVKNDYERRTSIPTPVNMKVTSDNWKYRPATDRQKDFLFVLGVPWAAYYFLNTGAAMNLIDQMLLERDEKVNGNNVQGMQKLSSGEEYIVKNGEALRLADLKGEREGNFFSPASEPTMKYLIRVRDKTLLDKKAEYDAVQTARATRASNIEATVDPSDWK